MKTIGWILGALILLGAIGGLVGKGGTDRNTSQPSVLTDAEKARRRQEAVKQTEHTLLMNGMEATVTEVGDAMHFDYALCGKSFLTQIQSVSAPLKDIGFRRLTCIDVMKERFEVPL